MFGLKGAAARHRTIFLQLLNEIGEEVVVRLPAPKPTPAGNDASKILGSRPTTTAATIGDTFDKKAIISGPSSAAPAPNETPATARALGKVAECDLVLRFFLDDVLLDETKRYGRTLLDSAVDVLVQGTTFKVEAMARGGLAPLGPYILWVGLKPQAVGR
jgi:hypothetical protein